MVLTLVDMEVDKRKFRMKRIKIGRRSSGAGRSGVAFSAGKNERVKKVLREQEKNFQRKKICFRE